MEIGIRKCVVLGMKKEKYEYSEGIHLPSEDEIRKLTERKGTSIWGC